MRKRSLFDRRWLQIYVSEGLVGEVEKVDRAYLN